MAALALAGAVSAADPVPVMVRSAAGRFEIAASDSTVAHAVVAQAEDAWRVLATPLALPEAFVSPVFFRIVASLAGPAETGAAFQVIVESGGVVSVRLRADAATIPQVRRAIVQGLLMRLAVAHHGVNQRLRAPLWLEEACLGWWQTRAEAAQLDALRHASAHLSPPPLGEMLRLERGSAVPPEFTAASVWLLTFFQAESGRSREWSALLQRLLAGDDPEAAVEANFPGRFTTPEEREFWWKTGWHHAVRTRGLPALDAAESRMHLRALARFVFAAARENADEVLALRAVMARAAEPVAAEKISRRAAELGRLVTLLHPFYRNAGLSLGEVFAARTAKPERRDAACEVFERDWRDAVELNEASSAALDALERKLTGR